LILIEPVAEKREAARRLGADICIDPRTEDVQAVLAKHRVDRISCVIECVGNTKTMAQALELAGKKSVVMFFGLTEPDAQLPIKPFELFKKEIVIKASFINPYTQKRALELIDSGKIDVTSVVYDCRGLEELPGILADGQLRARGKFIIDPQR
jgi:threonine dehydrogenase-like Zn-dependent dehydrogenase